MVYTCQFCGGWFPKDVLVEALNNKLKILNCPYCNNVNEVDSVKESHVKKGYDELERANFYGALDQFDYALRRTTSAAFESAKLDAYLGRALARQFIQVVYSDEDQIASHTDEPELNCYRCDDTLLSELDDYHMALKIAYNIPFSNRSEAVARVERFAKKIDGIKAAYNRRANIGDKYQLCIVYEDSTKDSEAGMMAANRIRDNLPSSIKNVFIQDHEGISDEEYEGSLLYAIHNSTCMLAVTDDDIDSRLRSIFARYYYAMNENNDGQRRHLGFISIGKNKQIILPDQHISRNVYDITHKDDYCRFVCEANMIAYGGAASIFSGFGSAPVQRPVEEEIEEQRIFSSDGNDGAPVFEGSTCTFGSYPQRRVMNPEITSVFEGEGRPSISDPNGWEIMFTGKNGQPYAWYKDKNIGEKKYRAVYFVKFREVFKSRNTDIMPSIQRMSNYLPGRIYVFSFDEIEWNVVQFSTGSAIIMSSIELESREFHNHHDEGVEWSDSSLRKWMNNDMLDVAFTPAEKNYLYTIDATDDHVSIMNSNFLSTAPKSLTKKLNNFNVSGSDYLKCLGGYFERTQSSFWVKSNDEDFGNAASVQPHDLGNIVSQCIDTTTVSVLPMIKVKLNNK